MPTNGLEVTRRTTLAGGLALGAMAGMPLHAQASDAGARLRALLEQADAADALLDPLSDERRGESSGPAYVDPLGDAYGDTLRANKQAQMQALEQIDRKALSPQDAIAYDVFAYRTREVLSLFDSGLFVIKRQLALDPSFGPHVEVADFVSGGGARFESLADYERGLERLKGFADYLQTAIVRLREGLASGHVHSQVVVANVLRQVDAMLALAPDDTPFFAAIRQMPDPVKASDGDRLTAAYRSLIRERILPGYNRWHDFLTQDYAPKALALPGRGAMPDGARLYAAELARHTTTSLSADEIHALGLSEVARIRAEMEALKAKIGFDGKLEDFFVFLRSDDRFYVANDDAGRAIYLKKAEDYLAGMRARLPEQFGRLPKADLIVKRVEAFREEPGGAAHYSPAALDGSRPGIFYVHLADTRATPIYEIEGTVYHEGHPGHHMQIALAQEMTGTPEFRKNYFYGAYGEGWALYVERLAKEMGFYTDPYSDFGRLGREIWRAIRLVVDTGIHAKGWSEAEALAYYTANSPQPIGKIRSEIRRYFVTPGQATSYKVGMQRILALRDKARTALGPRYDQRVFHEIILGRGSVPLPVLEAQVDRWIAAPA